MAEFTLPCESCHVFHASLINVPATLINIKAIVKESKSSIIVKAALDLK
jgi:hypothetical protein